MKKGEFLKDTKYEPLYDFINFEYARIGKKRQVLGTGAFGEVYLARNKLNESYYAIKHMYKRKIAEHGANLNIVQREINVHKKLVHENIIRMYSSYEDKDSFYLVRKY
jgi:serine/threonine protein kinase